MSFPLPAELRRACEAYAAGVAGAEIARRASALSERYRAGRSSHEAIGSREDAAAYLLARLPATYAAVSAALSAARRLMPSFAPSSLADLCAGPATASLAALALWPSLRKLALIDANPLLLEAARHLLEALPEEAHAEAELVRADLGAALEREAEADLVVMSYALVELPETEIASLAGRVFALARGMAVFVEPGTPEGFRRILICREALIAAGATLVAPCPHALPCPMPEPRWCHFVERLPRSREHRLAKGAELPFEDEAYSYLAFARRPAETVPEARILSRMRVSKVEARCEVCAQDGKLGERTAPRRDRAAYARMRRLDWGDEIVSE